jgi:hypothetical protein
MVSLEGIWLQAHVRYKPEGKRPFGRITYSWEEKLILMGVNDGYLVRDSVQ